MHIDLIFSKFAKFIGSNVFSRFFGFVWFYFSMFMFMSSIPMDVLGLSLQPYALYFVFFLVSLM